jgi:hypothetical protein
LTSSLIPLPPDLGILKALFVDENQRIYASSEERLYVSLDLGDTWILDLEMADGQNITWVRRVGDHLVVATTTSSWARKLAPL